VYGNENDLFTGVNESVKDKNQKGVEDGFNHVDPESSGSYLTAGNALL